MIPPFTKENCNIVAEDNTCKRIVWSGADDLSSARNQDVRFRFYLKNGKLYSFWVSPSKNGESLGYIAGGGPGFTGPIDTIGELPMHGSEEGIDYNVYAASKAEIQIADAGNVQVVQETTYPHDGHIRAIINPE